MLRQGFSFGDIMMSWQEFNYNQKDCAFPYPNRQARKQAYKEYKEMFGMNFTDIKTAKEVLVKADVPGPYYMFTEDATYSLASKPTVPPANNHDVYMTFQESYKEEGNKPMCNSMSFAKCQPSYTTAASSPTVILNAPAEKTESQTQRDYLLSRLETINRFDGPDLTEMFNLHVNNSPKNFEELIEKITKKQFTISKNAEKILARQKGSDEDDLFEDEDYDGRTFFYGPMEGIIWDGPKPDHEGYSEAVSEKSKAYAAAKDIIWVKSPEEGLAALEEFKKWAPSNAPKN